MFVGAHPDDETFMLGSTLAKYANEGHEIKIVCATKGEAGQWSDVIPIPGQLAEIRAIEHRKGLDVLGVKELQYLEYKDGTLANKDIPELIEKIKQAAKEFQPDILITPDLNGISGHIDHITMAVAATYAYQQMPEIKKLYYFVLPQDEPNLEKRNYWGREMKEISTFVDVGEWIEKKIEAAEKHATQKRDTEYLIPFWKEEMKDHFVLAGSRVETSLPEKDLWQGII